MDKRVARVLEVLSTDDLSAYEIEQLAEVVCLSVSRIRHLFRMEVGTSLGHYVKERRLTVGRKLLDSTFLRVKEIANRVGFQYESHFVREFKKRYGTSPAQYRRRQQS